jgi:hypothetical protein
MKKTSTPSKKKKVPQENPYNPMRGQRRPKKYLVQPHNYRRYFAFSKQGYNPTQPYSLKNYNSEYHFENFYGCRVVVRKNTVEIINLWHKKQWRLLEVSKPSDADKKIELIKAEMESICVKALKRFVNIHGGVTDFKPLPIERKQEIGIHGDDFIDRIPKSAVIHDTTFKKVYAEKLEFLGEASIKNYLKNRSLEDFSPIIANELKNIQLLIVKAEPSVIDWLFESLTRCYWFNNLPIEQQNEVLGI